MAIIPVHSQQKLWPPVFSRHLRIFPPVIRRHDNIIYKHSFVYIKKGLETWWLHLKTLRNAYFVAHVQWILSGKMQLFFFCFFFTSAISHKESAAIISTAGCRQSGVHLISFNDYISVSFSVLFYLRSYCGVT